MTADSTEPDVRIAVQQPPRDSEIDESIRSGPIIHRPDYTVVVPVTGELLDPDTGINVRRLLQTAFALAADNDGRVSILGIATVGDDSSLETVREYVRPGDSDAPDSSDAIELVEQRQSQVTQVVDVAQKLNQDIPINAAVQAVTDPTQGVLDVLGDGTEMAVLLLRGGGLEEGGVLTRSTIDAILAEAGCDVFVENLGTQGGKNALYVPDIGDHSVASLAETEAETIDTILLPVGSGAHSALATEAARAVALAAGASVNVLHVIDSDASRETRADAEGLLKFAEYVLGPDVESETELREADDTTDVIVQEAQSHDFTSIGAPEQKSRLERLVFGSVQETLTERSDVTVLMGRDSDQTMRSLYYRWKQGMDAMEESDGAE